MKRAMIHIGSGKTGTTSIQNSAAKMEKDGAYPDLTYPLVTQNGHQSLEILFKDYDKISRGLKSKFTSEDDYFSFKNNFSHVFNEKVCPASNVFLSSEFMFNFELDEVLCLKKYLQGRGFESFLIVVYLRDPASFYLSYIQQMIKGSCIAYSPFKFKTNYKKYIERWVSVFGLNNIFVREYDRSSLKGGNVLRAIESLVDDYFKVPISLPEISSNRSLTAEGMAVLQKFRADYLQEYENRFTFESELLIKRLSSEKIAEYGSTPRLKKAYENLLRTKNSDDISYLQENFGIFINLSVDSDSVPDTSEYTGCVVDVLENFDKDIYCQLLFGLIYEGIRVENNK